MADQIKKGVRLPDDLVEWVDSLPQKYGHTFTQKVRYLLELAKERQEQIDTAISEYDSRASNSKQETRSAG